MFSKKKNRAAIDQVLIDEVNSYVETALQKDAEINAAAPKFSRELSFEDQNIRYSRRDTDVHVSNLLRITELGGREPTFSEELIRYMNEKHYTASRCYKKAHIDRKLFSQITKNRDYKPKKNTVIAFILALELDRHEAFFLMNAAGYTLAGNNKFDLIIKYCIEHRIYDLDDVNEILYRLGQPILGSK